MPPFITTLTEALSGRKSTCQSVLADITAMFRHDYGDQYLDRTIYQPEGLIAANQSGKLTSLLACSADGRVLAHLAMLPHQKTATAIELGQAIVAAHARGNGIMTALVIEGVNRCQALQDCQAAYAVSVTHHVFSQLTLARCGFNDTALLYGTLPPGLITAASNPEAAHSALVAYRMLSLFPMPRRLFLPSCYADIVRRSCQALNYPGQVIASLDAPLASGFTDLHIEDAPRYGALFIRVDRAGIDTLTAIGGAVENAAESGRRMAVVYLNANDPGMVSVMHRLRGLGYFYGGILPRFQAGDMLVMQRELRAFSVEVPFVSSPLGNTITSFVLDDRAETGQAPAQWQAQKRHQAAAQIAESAAYPYQARHLVQHLSNGQIRASDGYSIIGLSAVPLTREELGSNAPL